MTEAWCDYGDLPKEQCAHCTVGDVVPPRPGSPAQATAIETAKEIHHRSPRAVAAITTRCFNCGEPIEEGDSIKKSISLNRWVHEECP